jgi:hypothetical protein
MNRIILSIQIFFILIVPEAAGQVKIRLFAEKQVNWIIFDVREGSYRLDTYDNITVSLNKGETAIFAFYKGKVAVKTSEAKDLHVIH